MLVQGWQAKHCPDTGNSFEENASSKTFATATGRNSNGSLPTTRDSKSTRLRSARLPVGSLRRSRQQCPRNQSPAPAKAREGAPPPTIRPLRCRDYSGSAGTGTRELRFPGCLSPGDSTATTASCLFRHPVLHRSNNTAVPGKTVVVYSRRAHIHRPPHGRGVPSLTVAISEHAPEPGRRLRREPGAQPRDVALEESASKRFHPPVPSR